MIEVIRTQDVLENHVFPYVYTPYLILITLMMGPPEIIEVSRVAVYVEARAKIMQYFGIINGDKNASKKRFQRQGSIVCFFARIHADIQNLPMIW